MDELKPLITHQGQPFVDRPIRATKAPPWDLRKRHSLFDGKPAIGELTPIMKALTNPNPPMGYERIGLRWVRPDGKGGFVEITPPQDRAE